ncbi:unnamed protein product, partial [Nippostrongylus brasiliensis]|uniref:SPATA6 domain-containing protein n=1 Tax=Nippostrongylus brasiliensis TaxID=27835 RepID=A0A0N4XT87_NIPBR
FCFAIIGRAEIVGLKSSVTIDYYLPQVSCPFGNFFPDTSYQKLHKKVTEIFKTSSQIFLKVTVEKLPSLNPRLMAHDGCPSACRRGWKI